MSGWSSFDLCDVGVATARQMGWLLSRQNWMKFCKDVMSMMNSFYSNSHCTLHTAKQKETNQCISGFCEQKHEFEFTNLYHIFPYDSMPCHVVLSIPTHPHPAPGSYAPHLPADAHPRDAAGQLPWLSHQPTSQLRDFLATEDVKGRALELGCGTGDQVEVKHGRWCTCMAGAPLGRWEPPSNFWRESE